MVVLDHKRLRRDAPRKPRKRQKREADDLKGRNRSIKPMGIDALPWNEARLPDRLEDAEGFFGLEEVSDVEIVKDEKLGRVEYRLSKSTRDAQTQYADSAEEDEWDGISDSNTTSGGIISSPTMTSSEPGVFKTQKKRRLDEDVPQNLSKARSAANGFNVLKEASDDEADVLSSLAKLRFAEPTPIQSSAIPEILDGNDVIGKASTGSGKTLAFGIPILEHHLKHDIKSYRDERVFSGEERQHPPTALILSPTRELAHQLSAHLTNLCSNITSQNFTIATLTGGLSLQKQQRILANADIIIGTPGRLWEIISSSKGLMPWLTQIKFFVLDEADRLLSEGHYKELEEILNSLNRTDTDQATSATESPINPSQNRQTLVFSATFAPSLQSKLSGRQKFSTASSTDDSLTHLLSRLNFRSTPKLIDASPLSHLPTSLNEHLIECSALEKDLYLYALLLCHFPASRTLIFTNSINSVRRLVPFLQSLNLPAHSLHSQMPQKARLRSVERFSASGGKDVKEKGSILVATDVAARGLDIPNVEAVLHYHLPRAADAYVHRSGRTARKGNQGTSVLICSPEEVQAMRRLVAKVHAQSQSTSSSSSPTKSENDKGIRTLELDRRIVSRLKPRTVLAKKIADAGIAKEKKGHEDEWLRDAAEELGVDYDSEDFAAGGAGGKGKGQGRRKKEERARGLSRQEVGAMKA
ncbi:MAG: hypothetical protein Q9225_007766, partial [Loekoesia sp. 1 TL-2023]